MKRQNLLVRNNPFGATVSKAFTLSLLLMWVFAWGGGEIVRNKGQLDHEKVKQLYFEGELEELEKQLRSYLLNPGQRVNREDSIILFKYLGVIHAVMPGGQARSENYMTQLVKLSPSIELVDLYVSETVESQFQKTKEKYLREQSYRNQYDELGRPIAAGEGKGSQEGEKVAPVKGSRKQTSGGTKKWIWASAVGAMVAVGLTSYILWPRDTPESTVTF